MHFLAEVNPDAAISCYKPRLSFDHSHIVQFDIFIQINRQG